MYKGISLAFDPENRLTAYGSVLTAGYTGEGLRAWKQTGDGRTYFLYDGILPVCELDALGNVTAINTFGVNGLLSRHSSRGGTFYTFDTQGSVAQRLDSQNNVLDSVIFDSYGSDTSTNTAAGPFGYDAQSGYYHDIETDLYLLSYRFYDASIGRFLTRDPIGLAGGVNTYAYAAGNPVNNLDPLGLVPNTLEGACALGPNPVCVTGVVIDIGTWIPVIVRATRIAGIIMMSAPGRQVDTAIETRVKAIQSHEGLAGRKRPDRCDVLQQLIDSGEISALQAKSTQKAWGCRPSRQSKDKCD